MIVCGHTEFDGSVQVIRSGFYRSNKISVSYTQEVLYSSVEEYQYEVSEKEFMRAESLGCEPPRRCAGCRGCEECGFRGSHMSHKEALELRMMEENVSFDESLGKWRVRYPFTQDPRILSNNYRRVLKMMESMERRLDKLGETGAANEVFEKMVSIGALSEVSAAELKMWTGPVHYLPIQAVIKPSSVTTRVRLVTNSSLVDPATGLSLNSILAKGPNYLNDMWEILVRFRNYEVGLCGDIAKAYYQMHCGPVERHLRRVLWRNGNVGTPWRIFAFEVVSMGDSPAANFMEITKRKTADRGAHIDRVGSQRLKKDSFVDDISTGGTSLECVRFKGNMDPVKLSCDGTMQQILDTGGYVLKAMGMSGEPDGLALEKLGGAVLGVGWSTGQDMMEERFKVNVSVYKRGEPSGPDLTVGTLDQLEQAVITKRVCLRVVSSQYSPLGILTPLLVILKVQMKEMYKLGLGWDTPLEGELRGTWVKLFTMLVKTGGIKFRRATRPAGAVGKCILVCFFDGADPAFGVVIYARWVLEDGKVWVYLVAAKCRVAPMSGASTVRMEMDGATLVTRLVYRVVHALMDDPPGEVIFIGDAETVLASRERDKGFFGEWFGNRIGEQFDNIERIETLVVLDKPPVWYHVASQDNAADRTTRLQSVPEDLGLDSEWLNGPAYLRQPVEMWPVDRNFSDRKSVKLPISEIRKPYRDYLSSYIGGGEQAGCPGSGFERGQCGGLGAGTGLVGPGSPDNYVVGHFDFGRTTNDWEKLVKKTSFLFMWLAGVQGSREMAVIFWMRVAMPATNKAAAAGKLKHLSPMQHSRYRDMLVVVGRVSQGFQSLFQKEYLPILMSSTRTAWLVMLWAHCLDHAGVDLTYQTSMQVAWIVGGRALARGIKRACVRCRYLAKQLLDQQMSVLPPHLITPCPCFSYIAVDLCGPFICKREGASKTTRRNPGTMKVWAVLFVCLQVKAVKIYLVGGLHTEDFLLAWDSFVADYGQPLTAYSDRGSNLVSAAREGGDKVPDYDWDRIAGCSQGKTDWQFHPAGSQFRNGAVEVFVKKFKRSLKHSFGSRLMFLLELETSFKVVSSILNSRPVYARWGPRGGNDPDFLSPLTPNMMLTGRAGTGVPVRDYDLSDKPLHRLQYVEECTAQWWGQYMAQNFSSLVPRQKWFYERRNMVVGDVVLLQYEGKCRPATYRLAVVVSVEVASDGLVRTVTVEYSLLAELPASERLLYKGVTKKRVRVSVQRLVLILPVEEWDQDLHPGGMASGVLAPPNEVLESGVDVRHSSGSYDVVWDSERKMYIRRVGGSQAAVPAGQHGGQPEVLGLHIGGGQGGGVGDVNRVHGEVTRDFRQSLKSCAVLKSRIKCRDFERNIYEKKSSAYDWSEIYEHFDERRK